MATKKTKKMRASANEPALEAAAGDDVFQFNASGTVDIQAASEAEPNKVPTFSLLGYTGGVMSVWRGATVIDLAGLALPKSVPVLHDHNPADPVGHGTPTVEGSNLTLNGTFSVAESASAQKIIASAKREFPWQASVGVAVAKFEKAAAGQEIQVNGQTFTAGADGLYVIRAGSLREISIVPLGADTNTSINVAASAAEPNEQEKHMPNEDNEKVQASAGRTVEQIVADAKKERERCQLIAAMIEEAASTPGSDLEALEELSAKAISEKWDLQATELAILRATRPKPIPKVIPPGGVIPPEQAQSVLEAATLMSCGFNEDGVAKDYGDRITSAARKRFKSLSLKELILAAARANGYTGRESVSDANLDELVRWGRRPQIQATGFSTVDLTGILGNVANKAIAAESTNPIWLAPQLAGVASHSNFHQHTVYTAIQTGTMEKVGPTGEIKHADMSEESYTRQLYTYAQILRVSRTDVVNDDLGVFASRARAMVEVAYKTRELALFTKIMVSGAGSSHFTAARGNYLTGASTALSLGGLNLALAAFRNLKGPDSQPTMVEPSILLVPSTLEATARELLTAGSNKFTRTGETLGTAIFQSDANIYAGRFGGAPLVSPYLEWSAITGYSAAYWYMFADPQRYPCYEVSYLNGQQAPQVSNYGLDSDPDTLGIAWRIYWDFGVDTALWRAGVKVAGA